MQENRTILIAAEFLVDIDEIRELYHQADLMAARGNKVWIAIRDPAASAGIALTHEVRTLAAPRLVVRRDTSIAPTRSFVELLANLGFDDSATLFELTRGWRGLVRIVKPDVMLIQHSPIALLASRISSVTSVLIGSGFLNPPHQLPWPTFLGTASTCASGRADLVLNTMNDVATRLNGAPLASLADLYHAPQIRWALSTIAEIDPYKRDRSPYVPLAPIVNAKERPSLSVRQIYVEVQPYREMKTLFVALQDLGIATTVRLSGTSVSECRRLSSGCLRFIEGSLPAEVIALNYDIMVVSGSNRSLLRGLFIGLPIVILPVTLEHLILTRCTQSMGHTKAVSRNDAKAIRATIHDGAHSDKMRSQALAFSEQLSTKYRSAPSTLIHYLENAVLSDAPA